MNCEICGSDKFIDGHHFDCKEGRISSETIDLCRRCHRTYHDRGVEWFDDDKIEKAIEIENKRREIWYANLTDPKKPLTLLRKEDIVRSDYWNKIHGIRKRKQPLRETRNEKQLGFEEIDSLMKLKV